MNLGSIVFDGALWLAVPLAALAGLVSFLSPCVLPLVPGYLGFLGGSVSPHGRSGAAPAPGRVAPGRIAETPTRGRLLVGVGLFIAGFTVVFLSMGVFAGALGRLFIEYQESITRVLGVVVIALGLVFVGVFGFAQRMYRPRLSQNLGIAGAPLLGLAMGIGWAPCMGPTLAAILSMAYSQADPARAGTLAIAYSLGLGIPFVLLALGAGWATRSIAFVRNHIRKVNIVGGVLLIALGIAMVSGVWTAVMSAFQGVVAGVPTFL